MPMWPMVKADVDIQSVDNMDNMCVCVSENWVHSSSGWWYTYPSEKYESQ